MVDSKESLEKSVSAQLQQIEKKYDLRAEHIDHLPSRIYALLASMHHKTGQKVVILVDEYDKAILDHLAQTQIALEMREALRSLYSVFKDSDAHVKFVFITGVSKFSKVSLFSGLNNLNDITLDPEFAALCGYTDADIDQIFTPEIKDLNRIAIREWYNGYNWRGTKVYNPFDVLLLFQKREFRPFWYEMGTPSFLVEFWQSGNGLRLI